MRQFIGLVGGNLRISESPLALPGFAGKKVTQNSLSFNSIKSTTNFHYRAYA